MPPRSRSLFGSALCGLPVIGLAAMLSLACASSSTRAPAPAPTPAPAPSAKETTGDVTMQSAAAPSLEAVYFDTDQALLRADTRKELAARAQAILAHPEWGVLTIEGHCDERGSDEYNLALGERRAEAVVSYLKDLGVPASRLKTVTFGEAKPAVAGHDESAWHYNRRSELRGEALQQAKN